MVESTVRVDLSVSVCKMSQPMCKQQSFVGFDDGILDPHLHPSIGLMEYSGYLMMMLSACMAL